MWLVVLGALVLFAAPGHAAGREDGEPRVFMIDGGASEVTMLLFREGMFSAFAHDHVLVSKNCAGRVVLDMNEIGNSTVQLSVPVVSFVVDAPADRAREKLAGELSAEQREEVRETMLGEDQLHVGKFPRISAASERVEGAWPQVKVFMKVRIKNVEQVVPIPVRLNLDGKTLTAAGEVELLQSNFGIEPFSSFLGTVAVKDRIRVKFHILAREDR